MQSYINRHRIFLMHLLFWCVYTSFFFYHVSSRKNGEEPDWNDVLKDVGFQVISMLFISYLNYFVFLPRFLKHRKVGQYLLEFLVPFAAVMYGIIQMKRYIIDGYTYQMKWAYTDRFTVQAVWSTFFLVLFVGMLKFVEDWFDLETKKQELEREKLTSELRFLKAQINPHFLFNTLNNLYYLAFTNSPNTTEVIDKLSQMMRYMLYESNHPKVPLNKEIDYMKSYISLEQLRLNNDVPINFKITGNTEGVQIVPLILITFLENAFKHGVSNNATDAWVNISIEVQGNTCLYTVENSKLSKKDVKTEEKSGIGLQNVKRRLDLSYPQHYDLSVQDLDTRYSVTLKLNL